MTRRIEETEYYTYSNFSFWINCRRRCTLPRAFYPFFFFFSICILLPLVQLLCPHILHSLCGSLWLVIRDPSQNSSILTSFLDGPSSIPNFLVEIFCPSFSLAQVYPNFCPFSLLPFLLQHEALDWGTFTVLLVWEGQIIWLTGQMCWVKLSAVVTFLSLVLKLCGKLAKNKNSVLFWSAVCYMIFKSPKKRTGNSFHVFTLKDRNPCSD